MTLAKAKSKAKTKADKQQKHQAIIDVAAALFQQEQHLPTVATIAKKSGQAKGTIYLYFSSKEAIFLTLLQQNYQQWFHHIEQTLTGSHQLSDLVNCFARPASDEVFLNLASLSSNTLEPAVDNEFIGQYRQWFKDEFNNIATLLNKQYPVLSIPLALSLLTNSHALMLGLWQQTRHQPEQFTAEVTPALARLWKGYFTG